MEAVALPAGEELKEWYAQSSWGGGEGLPPPLPMTGEEWSAHPGGRALPPSSSQPLCADLPIGEELKEWCAQSLGGRGSSKSGARSPWGGGGAQRVEHAVLGGEGELKEWCAQSLGVRGSSKSGARRLSGGNSGRLNLQPRISIVTRSTPRAPPRS